MAQLLLLTTSLVLSALLQGCSPSVPGDAEHPASPAQPTPTPVMPGNPHAHKPAGAGPAGSHPESPKAGPTAAPLPVGALPLIVMPTEYALRVHYTITTDNKTAQYLTSRAYDLNGTSKHEFQYREDDLINGKLMASTIELPTAKRAAFRYNALLGECVSWDYTAAVDGFPLIYREPPYIMAFWKNETVDGTATNAYQIVFDHWWNQQLQKFGERTYTVWFKNDTNVPVQIYDSSADVDGHLYTVTDFTTVVDEKRFEVPDEWKCKDPKAAAVVV